MLRKVILHGELGDLFIKELVLDVNSMQEAISALRANFQNFSKFILEYTPGFHVKVGDIYREETSLADPLGSNSDIHIIPAITGGSGKVGAALAIIVGVVLLFVPGAQAAGVGVLQAVGVGGAAAASFITAVGVGLVMSGISALLFAPPKAKDNVKTANDPNSSFNGAVNTIKQGYPVPVGYGELIIGSGVISAGIVSENIAAPIPPAPVPKESPFRGAIPPSGENNDGYYYADLTGNLVYSADSWANQYGG